MDQKSVFRSMAISFAACLWLDGEDEDCGGALAALDEGFASWIVARLFKLRVTGRHPLT